MYFQPLTLKDKATFDGFLKGKRYEASECTFTNFYMWRKGFDMQWTLVNDFLCVIGQWGGERFAFTPFGQDSSKVAAVLQELEDYFKQNHWQFLVKGVTTDMAKLWEAVRPGVFDFRADRDNYDYIYNAVDLIELKGRKYAHKKNHINYFKQKYNNYCYLPITDDVIEPCIQSALEWCRKHGCNQDLLLSYENNAIVDALQHLNDLELTGGAVLIDGKVEAFSLGEALNDEMAVIHIEKGNADIRGLYQIINQEFCKHSWSHMTYINREEDMGIEGLRKAKESYRPVKMIKKYDVTLRDA